MTHDTDFTVTREEESQKETVISWLEKTSPRRLTVVIETAETMPCDYTDQEAVAVDNQEKSSAEEPGDVDISDTSTGIQNVLENEDEISGEIHGKIFSKSDGSVNEIRKVLQNGYQILRIFVQ